MDNWKIEYEQWWRKPQVQSYGKDCEKLVMEPLRKLLSGHIPSKLYKLCRPDGYASVNLINNTVGTTRASEFNDPYDTLQFLNKEWNEESIRKEDPMELIGMRYKALYDTENFKEQYKFWGKTVLEKFVENVKNEDWTPENFDFLAKYPEVFIRILCEESINQLEDVLEAIRKETFVSCFTTEFQNMLMWSHYADSHKGFALGYDMTDLYNMQSIENLYPVCYSDKKIDVTIETSSVQLDIMSEDRNYSIDKLLGIKCSLFKSVDWSYENEWRMVIRDLDRKENWGSIPLKASEIYYGCRINQKTKEDLHAIAVNQGLREYQMIIDPFSDSYDMKYNEL